jgi:hypothetical protein
MVQTMWSGASHGRRRFVTMPMIRQAETKLRSRQSRRMQGIEVKRFATGLASQMHGLRNLAAVASLRGQD